MSPNFTDFSSRYDSVSSRLFSVVPASKPGEVPVVELYFPWRDGAGVRSSLAFGRAGIVFACWTGFGSLVLFLVGLVGFVVSNVAVGGGQGAVKSVFGFTILASFLLFVAFLIVYRWVFYSGKRDSLKIPLVFDSSNIGVADLLEEVLALDGSGVYSWEAHRVLVSRAYYVEGVYMVRSARNAPAVFKGFGWLLLGSLFPV